MKNIDHPHVFLTGASSGIGLEIARLLCLHGHEVWGTSRDLNRLPSMPRFHPIEMDLNDNESIERSFNQALLEAGSMHALINNAGYGHFGPLEELGHEAWQEQFQALVFGPVRLMQMALPLMRGQGQGLIVNISSLASCFPVPFMIPYSAAKAALTNISLGLRLETSHGCVRIVDIEPGEIHTKFNSSMHILDQGNKSFYQQAMRKTHTASDQAMLSAPQPSVVSRTVLKVLRARYPKPVYRCGSWYQARFLPFVARLGTPGMVESGIRRYYNLNRSQD